MQFPENGMHVDDVEVLVVEIADTGIRDLLNLAQQQVVRTNIDLFTANRSLEVAKQKEVIARETVEVQTETAKRRNELNVELEASNIAVKLAQLGNSLAAANAQREAEQIALEFEAAKTSERLVTEKAAAEQKLALMAKEQEQRITALVAETDAVVKRFGSAQAGFSEALLALSNNETLQKVAQAWSLQRAIGGDSVSEALNKVFTGSPLEGVMKKLVAPNPPVVK
jgi:major vault protein